MIYLLTEISIALLIAFLAGLLLGFLLCKITCGKHKEKSPKKSKKQASADDLMDELAELEAVEAGYDDIDEGAVIALDTSVDLDAEAYHIQTMEGIGPSTGDLFRGYGIATVGDYLRKLHAAHQREQASKDLNILRKPLDNWASMADLMRIDGIDHQFAELAQASNIATVKDLANGEASDLVAHMEEVNKSGKQLIAPNHPNIDQVQSWIAQARGMSQVVTF